MNRLMAALLTASILVLGLGVAVADDKLKVVYHVADEEKVAFALNNMQNHIDGVGGGENIELVMVSHGPAVKRFVDIEAVDKVRGSVAKLQEQGVTFEACANTLTALGIDSDELLAGFEIADKGGVTRIAELQSQGYAYIRP
ncbi:MAG: DsrE family protein [Thiohalocapsa sp.]